MTKNFTIENPMPPLWLMYPGIPQYSIGWRMGYGEEYKFDYFEWLETLSSDEANHYQEMLPEPKTWRGFYNDGEIEEGVDYIHGVIIWQQGGSAKYSKEWLMNHNTDSETVFFWKPGDIDYEPECCFGQWQYSEFSGDGVLRYTSMEQYMMASKARLFDDEAIAIEIMEANDPKLMKALGRKVKNFNGKIWDAVKYSIVLNGNYYKFTQNKAMKDILMATNGKTLVEASPLDTIWGIGYSKSNPLATDVRGWRGLNLLGFALMEVRDEIKSVYQNYDSMDWALVHALYH